MTKSDKASVKVINQHAPMGFVMFVAFVGSLVYFLQQANDFGSVFMALLKALVWPGILVYNVLQALGA